MPVDSAPRHISPACSANLSASPRSSTPGPSRNGRKPSDLDFSRFGRPYRSDSATVIFPPAGFAVQYCLQSLPALPATRLAPARSGTFQSFLSLPGEGVGHRGSCRGAVPSRYGHFLPFLSLPGEGVGHRVSCRGAVPSRYGHFLPFLSLPGEGVGHRGSCRGTVPSRYGHFLPFFVPTWLRKWERDSRRADQIYR